MATTAYRSTNAISGRGNHSRVPHDRRRVSDSCADVRWDADAPMPRRRASLLALELRSRSVLVAQAPTPMPRRAACR